MKMNEKIEIMLGRRRMRKTDFAESIGVTYRAFANYMNGSRTPRAATLDKMARELGLTAEFLTNDNEELELTIEERFIHLPDRYDSRVRAGVFREYVPARLQVFQGVHISSQPCFNLYCRYCFL